MWSIWIWRFAVHHWKFYVTQPVLKDLWTTSTSLQVSEQDRCIRAFYWELVTDEGGPLFPARSSARGQGFSRREVPVAMYHNCMTQAPLSPSTYAVRYPVFSSFYRGQWLLILVVLCRLRITSLCLELLYLALSVQKTSQTCPSAAQLTSFKKLMASGQMPWQLKDFNFR